MKRISSPSHRVPTAALPMTLALALLATAGPVRADEAAPAADSPLVTKAPRTAPAAASFTVGLGAAVSTRYSGSNETVALPLLVLDYVRPDGFFASTLRGLGYAGSAGQLFYSVALGYRVPRHEKPRGPAGFGTGSRYLHGMGDVKGSATALALVGYSVLPWLDLVAYAEQPLSARGNGARYGLDASAKVLQAVQDTMTLSASLSAGDGRYMQTYYGVSPVQAANAGYAAFAPKAGVYQLEATLSHQHRFSNAWSLTGQLGVQRLQGDAAKSPLTRRTTQPVAAVYASYAF